MIYKSCDYDIIQRFSQITVLFTSILKTLGSLKSTIRLEEGVIEVGGNSKTR